MADSQKIDMNKVITDAENGDIQALDTLAEMVFKGTEITSNHDRLYSWFVNITKMNKDDAICYLVRYADENDICDDVKSTLMNYRSIAGRE